VREIKLRAWKHINTPEMFNNVQAIDFKRGVAHLGCRLSSSTVRTDEESLNNLILMQYTGLTDKNGREIYEGDISWDEWNDCYGVVKFDEGKFIYEWENVCEDLIEVHDYLDISGNIYENPELLEVQT